MELQEIFTWYGLESCSRCGENHSNLDFKKLGNPIIVGDNKEYEFNYWGICPNTNEPVLMKISSLEDKE